MVNENTIDNNYGYSKKEIDEILDEQNELKLREEAEVEDQKWWDNMIKGAEEIAKQQEKDDHEYWMKHGDPDQQQARHDEKMAKLEQEEWENDLSRNYFGGVNDVPDIDNNSTYTDPEDENSVDDLLD